MSTQLSIRNYLPGDADQIVRLFVASVHTTDPAIYSEAQKEAWAPTPPDYSSWQARLTKTQPYVATINKHVVGFVELESDGHIDCFYVHPDHQRKGIAHALFSHLLTDAKERGISCLYVEASKVAEPFFRKNGFVLMSENNVKRRGQVLVNFSMEFDIE